MTVQMILVLMYSDQGLVRREKPICKCLPNLKALHWSDLFILMEGNHVMCIHPAGVLAPKLFFMDERLKDAGRSYLSIRIGSCYPDISLPHFVIPENITDKIFHPCVGFCPAVNDLIDCHSFSLLSLYFAICS